MKRSKIFKNIFLISVFAFLYAPILVLIVYSFNDSKLRAKWGGFTFKWYLELFNNREILNAVSTTLSIAVISTIISTILGTMAAIAIFYMKKWKRKAILNINYIPVLNPDIVTAISLMVLYKTLIDISNRYFGLKFEFGYMTMLLSHITFVLPYIVLSILPKLKSMNKHLLEAALDLGATPFQALIKVVIPEIKSGIFTGVLIALTLSLDDFVISFFTTGHGKANLSTAIYAMAKKGVNPVINALSTIVFTSIPCGVAVLFVLGLVCCCTGPLGSREIGRASCRERV